MLFAVPANCAALLLVCVAVFALPTHASAQQELLPCAQAIEPDSDADALSDTCELALAERFAPTLMVHTGGCNWDGRNERPGGGWFFAVQRVDSVVRIAYLPAYFQTRFHALALAIAFANDPFLPIR